MKYRSLRSTILLSALSVAAAACGDDGNNNTPTTVDGDAPTMAAVYSASGSTRVVLLTAEKITNANLIDSTGNGTLKVNTAFSTNVVIGRDTNAPAGQITLIDRTNNVLTIVDTTTSTVAGQIKVKADAHTNPEDIAIVDSTHAWVSRMVPNAAAACTVDTITDGLACGNDIIEYNPSTFKLTGRRVSFPNETVQVTAADGTTSDVTTYARPKSVIAFGSTLVVGLQYISDPYGTYGPGKLGLVDLSQDPPVTSRVDLTEGSSVNCGVVRKSGDSTVLVSCWGDWVDKHATGGVYSVDLSGDTPEVTALYEPRAADEVTAVGQAEPVGSTGHFVAEGDNSLYYMMSDSATQLVEHDSYSGYSILYDANSQGIIYSDRTEDSMGIFMTSTSTAAKVTGSDTIGLPPYSLAPIPQ